MITEIYLVIVSWLLEFRRLGFAALSGWSDVGAAGRSLFDFSGLQTAHADIDAAYRPVQKEDFYPLEVRIEAAACDA